MLLCFPDVYEVGMSHMGTRILYEILSNEEGLLADRCMMPWTDAIEQLRARDLPLVSLEHTRPLVDFDVVGFSLQSELSYTNVLAMLDLGRLPRHAAEREEGSPMVLGGGPNATHPEPLAPFFDAFFVGEAEALLPELLRTWVRLREDGVPRLERLRRMAGPYHLYVPALYERELDRTSGLEVVSGPASDERGLPSPVQRTFVDDLDAHPFPATGPEPLAEAVFDRAGVEIARGCTEGCRFCQAGMIYRPARERSPSSVLETMRASVEVAGHDEVSLTSLSTADYSAIVPLVDRVAASFREDRVALSVSSLRAYGLPARTLDSLREVRAAGLTFAPEAGTQRLRDVINKNVSEEELLDTAERVFERGWRRLKLYFMVGLPTETDEDLAAIVDVARRVRGIGRRLAGPKASVNVTVAVHVPKPHTPFQWCAMDSLEESARKRAMLRQEAKALRLELRTHGAEPSVVEGVLARGDHRVAAALEVAYELGCILDGWDEHFSFDRWQAAFEAAGIDPSTYLREIAVEARLPWDHIDVGLAEGFLAKEHRRALAGRFSPPCAKPFGGEGRTASGHHDNLRDHVSDERKLVCYDCGLECDLDAMRGQRADSLRQLDAIEPAPPPPAPAEPPPGKPGRRRPRNAPPERAPQGPTARLRLRYERLAPAHLVGHLDTARRIPRILRRAGIRPAYSQGFRPHPALTLGPPLPVGVESRAEVLDAGVLESGLGPISKIPERLNASSPPGIRFLSAERLDDGARTVSRAALAMETLVFVEQPLDAELSLVGLEERLCGAVQAFTSADTYEVEVLRKKGAAVRDARAEVLEIALDEREREQHRWAPPARHVAAVRVLQRLKPNPSVRPDEIVRALLGEDAASVETRCLRTRIELKA